jgi:orotidine-5'-phosphate decarboxylase
MKIIIPLDGMAEDIALQLIEEIHDKLPSDTIWGFKVNDLLLDCGLQIIKDIKSAGFKIMADPKLYDIPNTMTNSVNKLVEAGADIITVHCSTYYMPEESFEKYIAGVTVLTSFSENKILKIYGKRTENLLYTFTNFCNSFKYNYMVCSPKDISSLPPTACKLICPGIRPNWYQKKDDQKRTMTPKEAVKAGADLLVIGRPILNAKDIIEAIKKTNEEIKESK